MAPKRLHYSLADDFDVERLFDEVKENEEFKAMKGCVLFYVIG